MIATTSAPSTRVGVCARETYCSHVARLFVDHAMRYGVRLEQAPALEIPFETLVALGDQLSQMTDQPFFGLDAARHLPRGAYGVVEYVCANAATVGECVELALRFQSLTTERACIASSRHRGSVTFEHWVDHPAARGAIHANEFALATYLLISERIIGRRPPLRAVRFMHDGPGRAAVLEEFFGAPVELGAERNAMVCDESFLATRIASADPTLFGILAARAEHDLALAEPHGDLAAAIRNTYRRMLTRRPRQVQAEGVARELGLSVRSMNRHLAELGLSFRVIEADVKRAFALAHLEDARLSLTEIAFALGFADTSTFIRAFRRWTGKTPNQIRSKLRDTMRMRD